MSFEIKSFDIVIVNWNSGRQLKECISSVLKARKDNCLLNKIIVIDNNSSDDSIDMLDKNINNLKIIKNKENLGFAKACNIGAKECQSDFILFLNPDMLIFEDTFTNLFSYIEKHNSENIAVYGIQLLNDKGNIQKTCARFPKLTTFIIRSLGLNKVNSKLFPSYTMEDWNHLDTREVDHVIGAFYLIKRNTFIELSGFDERYFVYMEDLDLSKRVKEAGYKSIYIAESQAYHKGGGTSENIKAKRIFYSTRSRIIYAFKHFGFVKGFFLLLFTFLIEPLTRTVFLLIKGNIDELMEIYKGFGMLYKDTANIIKLGVKK